MIKYELKKSELKIFWAVAGGKTRLSEIARDAGVSVSRASQLLASLSKKDFLKYERMGRIRVTTVSHAKHASLLKSLVQFGYNVVDVFSYSKLDILFSLLPVPKTLSELAKKTKLSPETLRKYVRELKYLAVVFETPEKKISLSPYPPVEDFLTEYQGYVNRRTAVEFHKDATLFWEQGREIIIRIPLPHEVDATPTGITAMSSYSIDIISNYGYYYYAPFDYKLRKEDIALHTILIGKETRNISYALLLLKKSGFEKNYLMRRGEEYRVDALAREMVAYLEGKGVTNPIFPPRKEFEVLCRQYGVG